MAKVKKVLLLLKNMVYESNSPQETLKFAKFYRSKGLKVLVILWGPMGVLLAKKDKPEDHQNMIPLFRSALAWEWSFGAVSLPQI